MPAPLISAVVPCYNQGHFLREAVDSLLAQTVRDLEIIIVNDGSTDPCTLEALPSYNQGRCRVINRANGGLPVARNTGIAAANGKYILCLDSDDKIAETFAEKALALLEADAGLGIVTSAGVFFGDRHDPIRDLPATPENVLMGKSHHSLAMFRKSDWEQIGGFDPALKMWEDMDFWLSIMGLGRTCHRLDEPLYFYRQHEQSMTSQLRLVKNETAASEARQNPHLYVFKKHQNLYLQYPEMLVTRLFGLDDDNTPKFLKFKKIKYRIILLLAKIPLLDKILARQARRARRRLEKFG